MTLGIVDCQRLARGRAQSIQHFCLAVHSLLNFTSGVTHRAQAQRHS